MLHMSVKSSGVDKKSPGPVDYGEHLGTKPVVGSVSVQKMAMGKAVAGTPISETQLLHKGVFSMTPGMSITVEGGRTLNLGNYESARIGVTITIPCSHDSLGEAYEWGTSWVSDRIEEAVKQAKGEA